MSAGASPRRFAQAAFAIAVDEGRLDDWQADLGTIAAAVRETDIAALLDSPQVPLGRKLAAMDEAIGDRVGPLARNLCGLLASRNAVATAPDIADGFERMLDEHRGVVRARVTTAVELSAGQLERVADALGRAVGGGRVEVTASVDPAIIGGISARVGDRLVDGSVRTRLEEMRRELTR